MFFGLPVNFFQTTRVSVSVMSYGFVIEQAQSSLVEKANQNAVLVCTKSVVNTE